MQAPASRSCRDQISRGGEPPGLSGGAQPFSYQEMPSRRARPLERAARAYIRLIT